MTATLVQEITSGEHEGALRCGRCDAKEFSDWCEHKEEYVSAGLDGSLLQTNSHIIVPIFPTVCSYYGWIEVVTQDVEGMQYAVAYDPAKGDESVALGFLMPGEGRATLRSSFLSILGGEIHAKVTCGSTTHGPSAQAAMRSDLLHGKPEHKLVQRFFLWNCAMCKACAIKAANALQGEFV